MVKAAAYVATAKHYAEAVVAGDVAACKWVRLACQRQLDDLARFKGKASPYRFNPKLTDKAGRSYHPADNLCAFVERLPHVKGPLAGETIELEPWQVFVLSTIFGWVKADGRRRFRRAYIEVPRGNGKALAADTLIPTPSGWKAMADLEVGDQVFDEQGKPCNVTAVTALMRDRPCYRTTFSTDGSIVADETHEWLTSALQPVKGDAATRVRTTGEIYRTQWSAMHGAPNHSVALAGLESPLARPCGQTAILRVEPTASVPVKFVEVDSASHLHLAGESCIPTHNSALSSALALYMLAADGESGGEIYSLATTRDQARIVFGDAQAMARQSPGFRSRFGVAVGAHNMNVQATGSKFEALSAEGSTLDGLNIHFGCIDELHAHKTRTVYDVVETGTGKRDNSLLWVITTAGSNRSGICYEVRTFVTRLLDGVFEDDSQFGIVYGLDDDDWTLESSLIKANPNWGVSVRPEVLLPLQAKAMQMPSAVNNFKTKHLNEWVNADTAWMDMRSWDRCADPLHEIDSYAGQSCWIGLDVASKTDIAALLLVFAHPEIDGGFAVFGRYYLPEDTVHANGNSQYRGWMGSGRLTVTPGNVIDFSWIEADLIEFASRFAVQAVAFDPFQATQLSTRMLAEGLPMLEVRPTVLNFSEPMKILEALVLQGKLIHDGCPVLGWMVSNVVAHLDAKDNIYPRKERPENKIDGIVALIMALSRAITPGTNVVLGSDYELVLL